MKSIIYLSPIKRACITTILCLTALLLLSSCSKPLFPFGQGESAHIEKTAPLPQPKQAVSSVEKAKSEPAAVSKAVELPIVKPAAEKPVNVDPPQQQAKISKAEPVKAAAPKAAQKKVTFFSFLKPLVEQENELIMQQRLKLKTLSSADHLKTAELLWLHQLANAYRISFKGELDATTWNLLLQRVDLIPLEMALVQAANESAWGQSRFARQANNYFGHWCYKKGCGLVPLKRSAGAKHEVRSFASPNLSVRAYMKNINTSRAYAEFRQMREDLRHQHQTLDAELLAVGLKSYSERGMAYVKVIQSMIRSNRKLIQQV